MSSAAAQADISTYIVERLVGDTGEPDRVIDAARALAERTVPAAIGALNGQLASSLNMEVRTVELARLAGARPQGVTNHAMVIVPSATSPDALLMLADPDAIAVVLNAMFGGDPALPVTPITRDLSPTEITIAGMIFGAVAEAVNGSGTRSFDLRFPLGPAKTGEEMAKHVVRDGPAVRIELGIFGPGCRGTVTLLMPQRVFVKHRGDTIGQEADVHTDFGARFGEEVMRSAVTLEATMPMTRLTLGQIAGLHVGQVLAIDAGAQSAALLSARNNTLFVCEFGKLGNNFTVRINQPYDAAQDLMAGLMPH